MSAKFVYISLFVLRYLKIKRKGTEEKLNFIGNYFLNFGFVKLHAQFSSTNVQSN